jgi:diguanylate cyclase (GGDEF)-like protein
MLDRLSQRVAFLQRYGGQDVLILLNVDRFKIINDARGNQTGDAILCGVGKRIQSLLREADTVARMTADEFAILVPCETDNPEQLSFSTLALTERIRESIGMPFEIEGESFSITVSLGITLLPSIRTIPRDSRCGVPIRLCTAPRIPAEISARSSRPAWANRPAKRSL